jgi:hypothetical protein
LEEYGTVVALMMGAVRPRSFKQGETKMLAIRNKWTAAILGLAMLFAATTTADAQSYRNRLSGGEKAAIIGGSAAAGALIGGLLGGKKGAIIGGVVGAGGGTAYSLSRNDDDDRYRRNYRGRYYTDNRFIARNRFYNDRWNDRRDWYRWRYRR